MPERQQPKPDDWTAAVSRLIDLRGRYREWEVRGAALDVLRAAERRWRAQRREESPPEHVAQALRKAGNSTLRIATVIAESLDPGRGGQVPAAAVSSAVALVDFVIATWQSMPGERSLMKTSWAERMEIEAADKLLTAIEGKRPRALPYDPNGEKVRYVTAREAMRGHLAGCQSKDEVDQMFLAYADRYGRNVVMQIGNPKMHGGGRVTVLALEPARSPAGVTSVGTKRAEDENPYGEGVVTRRHVGTGQREIEETQAGKQDPLPIPTPHTQPFYGDNVTTVDNGDEDGSGAGTDPGPAEEPTPTQPPMNLTAEETLRQLVAAALYRPQPPPTQPAADPPRPSPRRRRRGGRRRPSS